MKLLQFNCNQGGYKVWICPDMIVSVVQTSQEGVTNITLENAIVQAVDGDVETVAKYITDNSAEPAS